MMKNGTEIMNCEKKISEYDDKKRKNIGKKGELIALEYLDKRGFEILEKNFSSKFGEIDIIARKNDIFCFVETKTRTNFKFGRPSESVTHDKRRKIKLTALFYLSLENKLNSYCRFDVIEVFISDDNKYYINHLENVF